jgi:hypothetical protein
MHRNDRCRLHIWRNKFEDGFFSGGYNFLFTFDAGLPDGVGVAESGDDVVADREGELEPVGGSFLEREPHALRVGIHRQRKEDVVPPRRQDGQAHDLDVRLQRLCGRHGSSNFGSNSSVRMGKWRAN